MPKKGEDVEGEPVELELEQLRRSASTEQSASSGWSDSIIEKHQTAFSECMNVLFDDHQLQ